MKKAFFVLVLGFNAIFLSNSQSTSDSGKSCSVVLINNHWMIDSYNKNESIAISRDAKGVLSVHETGDISLKSYKKEQLQFKVAILRGEDNTIVSYSEEIQTSIKAEEVLKKCKVGDKLLIILLKEGYSLPHNQIEVI